MAKYRIITSNNNIIVVTKDGGIAEIRHTEENPEFLGRQATTEYYQNRLTNEIIEDGEWWEALGEGKAFYNDWQTPFTDPAHILNALQWLVGDETQFVIDETIWPEFTGE